MQNQLTAAERFLGFRSKQSVGVADYANYHARIVLDRKRTGQKTPLENVCQITCISDRGLEHLKEYKAMYDAILLVSFGGPEKPDDVLPFLENVLRGKAVPRERLLEVAEHYRQFGGHSPINDQNRALIAALESELQAHGIGLPVYWGNRNSASVARGYPRPDEERWVRHALGFFTSAYSSYSGCRQYREDIATAQRMVGEDAPRVDKIRAFYNHPGFIEAVTWHAGEALAQVPGERRCDARLLFTAHSIPMTMAITSRYVQQLEEASRLVAEALAHPNHRLVYQSPADRPRSRGFRLTSSK